MPSVKTRLTITLDSEILSRVDAQIDGHKIRNRSHAIELLVSAGLQPKVTTAVILAGGAGKLAALSLVHERPALSVMLEHLKRFGITKVILCAGSHQAEIAARFGDGSHLGLSLLYVEEVKPQGTAGALRLAQPLIGAQPFLVVHGDVLTELNVAEFIQFHLEQNTIATIGVKPRMGEAKYGQAFLQGNKIVKFLQRGADRGISIVNTGLYVLDARVFERIPRRGVCKLETDIFPNLAEDGELSAFLFQGLWQEL